MVVEHAHGLRQRRGPNAKSSLHKAHLAPDAGLQAPGASLSFAQGRSEEHTSELQSLMRISYAVFCLKKKTNKPTHKIELKHVYDKYITIVRTLLLNPYSQMTT